MKEFVKRQKYKNLSEPNKILGHTLGQLLYFFFFDGIPFCISIFLFLAMRLIRHILPFSDIRIVASLSKNLKPYILSKLMLIFYYS